MSFAVLSPTLRRVTVPLLGLLLILSGCSKKASREELQILGMPPDEAFLGVEYYYDFGVDGGDGLLNFSLTNAPRWLSAELVTNHARKGVVIRGVPGVTGGGAGRADLDKPANPEIVLTVYDGDASSSIAFTITTHENTVQASSTTVIEGQGEEPPEDEEGEPAECVVEPPEITTGDSSRLKAVYIPVVLANPSVQDIAVRFKTVEEQQVSAVQGTSPDGPDVDYLEHEGVLEFAAGTTTCYVKVWIVDDTRAEDSETFRLVLEGVDKGLVKLGSGTSSTGNATITIEDDEPVARFELSDMVVSEGGSIEVTATLDRAPETRVTAEFLVYRDERAPRESTNLADTEYVINADRDVDVYQLVFDPDELAGADPIQRFEVEIPEGMSRAAASDRRLTLAWKRSETARESPGRLRIHVNQWTQPLLVDLGPDGQLVDLLTDQNSRVLLGYSNVDPVNDRFRGRVDLYDRFGGGIIDFISFAASGHADLDHQLTAMTLREYEVAVDIDRTDQYQDLYLVGTTVGNTAGPGAGGNDVLVEKWRKVNEQAYSLVWARQIGSAYDDRPHAVHVDSNHNVFIVGETRGAFDGSVHFGQTDAFIIKFDAGGQLLLATNIGSAGNDVFVAAVGSGQNLEVAGYSDGEFEDVMLGGKDVIVASYNREAQIRRMEQFGNELDNQATSMTILNGDLMVGGHTAGALFEQTSRGGQDAFLAFMGTASQVDDLYQFGSVADDAVLDLVTNNQSIFVTGYVGAALASDVLLEGSEHFGGRDAFLGRIDLVEEGEGNKKETRMNPVWFRQLGSAGNERGVSLGYTPSHKLMLATELEGATTSVRVEPFDGHGESLIVPE